MSLEHQHNHEGPELSEAEMEEQFKAFQHSQQVYLEQTFKWLIDFIASYFPEDQLAIRDMDLEVHFVHQVKDGGKLLGALIYRFRKFVDKKDYFKEIAKDYEDGLKLPEVLFVDTETSKFEPPENLEGEEPYIEMPGDKLTGKIREMREELKRRARLRLLRQSL
jgi:hypothetical protein